MFKIDKDDTIFNLKDNSNSKNASSHSNPSQSKDEISQNNLFTKMFEESSDNKIYKNLINHYTITEFVKPYSGTANDCFKILYRGKR